MRRAAAALVLLGLIIGCSTSSWKAKVAKSSLDGRISLGDSNSLVESEAGKPERKMNIEGLGYYGYREYGVFFDNIVSYYVDGGAKDVPGNRARVIAIDYLDTKGILGLHKGTSTRSEVLKILGRPSRSKRIESNKDILSIFVGSYDIYDLAESKLALSFAGERVDKILLVKKDLAEFN